jgi:nucleotidyltransferase/DNA polymerase involved in DNA repair
MRGIVHIDLDAFYAQVEQTRLGIPVDEPLCVQQWSGLIAVNYAARAKGIKRHCSVDDAFLAFGKTGIHQEHPVSPSEQKRLGFTKSKKGIQWKVGF